MADSVGRPTDRPCSIDHLPRPPIPPAPVFTDGTPLAVVVNPLLMRTADDSVRHHDRAASLLLDELQDFAGDAGVMANVAGLRLPGVSHLSLRVRRRDDGGDDFRRPARVRSVKCDSRDRPTALAFLGLLA